MRSFAGISLLLSASLALAQDAPTFTVSFHVTSRAAHTRSPRP